MAESVAGGDDDRAIRVTGNSGGDVECVSAVGNASRDGNVRDCTIGGHRQVADGHAAIGDRKPRRSLRSSIDRHVAQA